MSQFHFTEHPTIKNQSLISLCHFLFDLASSHIPRSTSVIILTAGNKKLLVNMSSVFYLTQLQPDSHRWGTSSVVCQSAQNPCCAKWQCERFLSSVFPCTYHGTTMQSFQGYIICLNMFFICDILITLLAVLPSYVAPFPYLPLMCVLGEWSSANYNCNNAKLQLQQCYGIQGKAFIMLRALDFTTASKRITRFIWNRTDM